MDGTSCRKYFGFINSWGGMIYLMDEEGGTYVFHAKPSLELLAKNCLQERTLASGMAYDNTLVIRTEVALYRFGKVSKAKN